MSEFFFAVNCNMFIRYSSLMKTRGLHLNFFRAFQNGRAIAQLHGMTARQKGRGFKGHCLEVFDPLSICQKGVRVVVDYANTRVDFEIR